MGYRNDHDIEEHFERVEQLEEYLKKIGAKNNPEKKEDDCISRGD